MNHAQDKKEIIKELRRTRAALEEISIYDFIDGVYLDKHAHRRYGFKSPIGRLCAKLKMYSNFALKYTKSLPSRLNPFTNPI
jgi:hypothetical protein